MDAVQTVERRLARQLESSFASDMLSAARPQKRQGLLDGGPGAGAFDSFMESLWETGGHCMGNHDLAHSFLGTSVRLDGFSMGYGVPVWLQIRQKPPGNGR